MTRPRAQSARERDSSPAPRAGLFRARTALGAATEAVEAAPGVAPPGRRIRATLRGAAGRLRRPELHRTAAQGYRRERWTELTLPVAVVLTEGGFIGVIADKMYGVPPSVLALVTAAPMFANLSSFLWARLAHGRRKVPLIAALQLLLVAMVGSIALLPPGPTGAWLLVGLGISCRLVLGGMITIRSLVWTLNYPEAVRARVTSRLAWITQMVLTGCTLGVGALLDANPDNFHLVYGTGALVGSLGVLAFSGVRVLGEREHIEAERGGRTDAEHAVAPGLGFLALLRNDPLYARYQLWQFLLGCSNMISVPPIIYLISREMAADYFTSLMLVLALPVGMSALTLPLWAVYMDRVHITEFRRWHSWLFVASQVLTFAGAYMGSLLWIGAGRALLGVAYGGGGLAWQLGHNAFARPENVGMYMGLHVTLTGVRGAVAPFLGMWLYTGWPEREIAGLVLPGFEGLGAPLFALAALLAIVASLGYRNLHRDVRRTEAAAEPSGALL